MSIMNYIRLDINYLVIKLSRFNKNPSNDHWNASISILKFLKFMINYGLHYMRYPIILEDIVIRIGYQTQEILIPQVVICLP